MMKRKTIFSILLYFNYLYNKFVVVDALPPWKKIVTSKISSDPTTRQLNTTVESSEAICHDSSEYRSPLNALWTCEHHRTIPCERFVHIGLNETGLEHLFSSCPESCKSECSSISTMPSESPTLQATKLNQHQNNSLLVEIDIFILTSKHESMSENEKTIFEQVSLDYLRAFFRKSDRGQTYHLKAFEINSQTFVDHKTYLRRSREMEESATLKIVATATFESKRSLPSENLIQILRLGVESDGYIKMIGNHIELNEVKENVSHQTDFDKNPTESKGLDVYTLGAVIVAIITSMFLISILIYAVITRRRQQHLHFTTLSPQFHHQYKHFKQTTLDPVVKGATSDNKKCIDEGVIRSFKLRVDECEMKEQKRFNQDLRRQQQQHQLQSVIPPMIVIDNIDDEDDSSASQPQMTSRLADDENRIGTALINVTNLNAPPAVSLSLSTNHRRNNLQSNLLLNECLPQRSKIESEKESPLSLLSSRASIDETTTPTSTVIGLNKENYPSNAQNEHSKGVFSFHQDFDMEPEDDFTVLFEKKMKEGGKRSFNFKDFFKRNREIHEERSFSQMSHYESDADLSEISSVVRRNDGLLGQVTSPSIGSENDYSVDFGKEMSPIETRNAEIMQKSSNSSVCGDFPEEMCKSPDALKSLLLYSFEAPICGKLGMTIQSAGKLTDNDKSLTPQMKLMQTGPSVLKIKGYSPLLGMVEVGDIIVSVDNINTQRMSTSEITALLESKRCENKEGRIKICVISTKEKAGFQPESFEHLLIEENSLHSSPHIEHDKNGENDKSLSSGSDETFHLIDTGISDEDDESFHMIADTEEYM